MLGRSRALHACVLRSPWLRPLPSAPQVPDFINAKIGGKRAGNVIRDSKWLKEEFTPKVGGARGLPPCCFCGTAQRGGCAAEGRRVRVCRAPLLAPGTLCCASPPLAKPTPIPLPFHPPPVQVANRGGALIKKWGRSSAASTAVSIADHLRSLYIPTPPGDCFSTAVYTEGNPYGARQQGCTAGRCPAPAGRA